MRRKTYGLTKDKAERISKNTEEAYKNQYADDTFVCPVCLESCSTKPFIDEDDDEPTEYYTTSWYVKGDRVRVCYNCFHYNGCC